MNRTHSVAALFLSLTGLLLDAQPKVQDPGVVVIRPELSTGPLDNPLKGYCVYTDAGRIYRPYSMVFLYVSWKELEPTEGQYAFDEWEKAAWAHKAAVGKHVVLRVYADYPGKSSGVPDWLLKKGVTRKPYRNYGGGLSPDYDHPATVSALEKLIAAMGKRYNDNPRVAFIQLGLLGFWGEWHTYPRDELFASEKTQGKVLDAYRKAFPDKQLMARYADGLPGRYPLMGFHDDMFPEDTDNGKDWSFLARLRRAKRIETWKRTIIGGEMVPNAARKWLGKKWNVTLDMLKRSHFTWVGPYGPALQGKASQEFIENSDELVRRMGYQYRLKEIRYPRVVGSGRSFKVLIQGVNDGVAPFYYPRPVKLAWMDDQGQVILSSSLKDDIRGWLPGEFAIDGELPTPAGAGIYRLTLGIEDPWTQTPGIRFANKLPVSMGWTILGEVEVVSGRK
ncbi:MAG: DUF4832 domain-containing protein [Opitutales bacterium]|nr:DUF4832 domain-containing protein [Opitutales bacterium]